MSTKSKVEHLEHIQDCLVSFSPAKRTVNRQCLGADQLACNKQASASALLELEPRSHGSVLQEAERCCGYIKSK